MQYSTVINNGFDQDCDSRDKRAWQAGTGER